MREMTNDGHLLRDRETTLDPLESVLLGWAVRQRLWTMFPASLGGKRSFLNESFDWISLRDELLQRYTNIILSPLLTRDEVIEALQMAPEQRKSRWTFFWMTLFASAAAAATVTVLAKSGWCADNATCQQIAATGDSIGQTIGDWWSKAVNTVRNFFVGSVTEPNSTDTKTREIDVEAEIAKIRQSVLDTQRQRLYEIERNTMLADRERSEMIQNVLVQSHQQSQKDLAKLIAALPSSIAQTIHTNIPAPVVVQPPNNFPVPQPDDGERTRLMQQMVELERQKLDFERQRWAHTIRAPSLRQPERPSPLTDLKPSTEPVSDVALYQKSPELETLQQGLTKDIRSILENVKDANEELQHDVEIQVLGIPPITQAENEQFLKDLDTDMNSFRHFNGPKDTPTDRKFGQLMMKELATCGHNNIHCFRMEPLRQVWAERTNAEWVKNPAQFYRDLETFVPIVKKEFKSVRDPATNAPVFDSSFIGELNDKYGLYGLTDTQRFFNNLAAEFGLPRPFQSIQPPKTSDFFDWKLEETELINELGNPNQDDTWTQIQNDFFGFGQPKEEEQVFVESHTGHEPGIRTH